MSVITDTSITARNIFLAFLLFLATLVAIGIYATNTLFANQRSISVVGVGRETVQSTKATITFAYISRASSKDAAATQGEQEFSELLTIINNFQPTDVRRVAYQVQEISPSLHQYASGASVTVEGTANITGLQRALSTNNAQVASVLYIPENEEETTKRVQELALEDAREKAAQIANASGGTVGKVITVVEQSSNAGSGTSVTSLTGNQDALLNQVEVQSVVSVTYELR